MSNLKKSVGKTNTSRFTSKVLYKVQTGVGV